MRRAATLLVTSLAIAAPASAQHPLRHHVDAVEMRFARSQPVISYVLRVDSTDLTGWSVEMRIRNVPDSFQLAMAKHPEYDDRYWRFVERLTVTSSRGTATIASADSALWNVRTAGGEALVRYRIALPPAELPRRAAWRPFLAPTGGLTGGPHAFMYVRGAELAPSHVRVEVPASWQVATALARTTDANVYFAPSVGVLAESPIFVGRFHDWRFEVDGVPHRVAYWRAPNGVAFDTAAFVRSIDLLTRESVALFGRPPYRDYTFILQDEAYGGLEHPASVTIGAASADLARDVHSRLAEIAHEYIHTWNLMRIRPAEYTGVSHRAIAPTAGLWFSEGLTIFYADALLRRAGLPTEDSTRTAHLTYLLERYLDNPGYLRYSAEAASRLEYNAGPLATGNYNLSTHTLGETIGTMLDFIVRDATSGARSMDDVMRSMLERHSGPAGFVGRDVERAVADVCRCAVKPFFDAHVRGSAPIDVARYLRLAGLHVDITRPIATRDGQPDADFRVAGWRDEATGRFLLRVFDPRSAWARAGLNTGDHLVSMNGTPVATWPEFRATLRGLKSGDSVRVVVARPTGEFTTVVRLAPFERVSVRVTPLDGATAKQVAIRERWISGR